MGSPKFNTKILTGSLCVNSLELLSKLTRVSKKTADSHLEENEKNWIEFKQNLGSRYIERQHDLDMFKYGSYRKNLQKMLEWLTLYQQYFLVRYVQILMKYVENMI